MRIIYIMNCNFEDRQHYVAAINLFHSSIQGSSSQEESGPKSLPVFCTGFHLPKSIDLNFTQIYICDPCAFNLFKAAFMKVSVVAEGTAWPHVSIRSDASLEWILLGDELKMCISLSELPPPYVWFIIPSMFCKLFDFTISLLQLPIVEMPSFINNCSSTSLSVESLSPQTGVDTTLKMIMSGPAYLLVSIFQAPSSVHVGEEDTTGQKYRTSCVASTNTQWYKHSACTNSYPGRQKVLDYDIVIDHIPDTLQAFVDSLSRRSGLHSEITIKDEPVCVPELNACTNLYCARTEERKIVCGGSGQAPEEDIEEHHSGKEKESSAEIKKCNGEAQIAHSDNMGKCKRSTFTLLQCPKCPKSFKYSLRVNGLNSIIAHVYDCHERSTGYCISTIKKRYANLIINGVHPRKGLPSNVTSKV